mmetsp:Transcript_72614/g.212991  ORF Transcript_72614/g.212991 Transcript_72614/m.212991 type:complete len:164 (-) Transcript_72614:162-653(-)
MGCGCAKATGVSDPQTQQRRDEQLARQLQAEEDRRGRAGPSAAAGGGRAPQPPAFTGQGRSLGGGQSSEAQTQEQLSAEERRQRALEAAEKRSVNVPGISQQKAIELRDKQQKSELLGKLAEHYQKKKMELPMGLNAATTEQLRNHWNQVRTGELPAEAVLRG